MINQSFSNQNLKISNASFPLTAPLIKKDSILNYQVTYKKKEGILSLSLRDKVLLWKSLSDSSILSIYTDQISEIKKDKKERDQTELLYIKKLDMDKGIVFVFSEENKTEMRDKFYEILIRREDEYEKIFHSLSTFEKKKILYFFNDEFLSFLYDELVTKKILNKEEFWIFLKKKYTSKISFLNTLQLIQLSRNEELTLFNNPFRNIMDNLIKKKLLLSYDDLNILYETYIKPLKSEDLFWREFVKNQKKYQTEMSGGLKPIFFSSEEEKIIEKEKNRSGNISQSTDKTSNVHILNLPVLNQAIQKYKISNRFENIETHKFYTHKHFGPCFNIAEYDYKDRVIKDSIEKEEFNRKEIDNFISSINEYSKRKMENINYISKNNFNCILSRFKVKTTLGKNITNLSSDVFGNKDDDVQMKNGIENKNSLRKKLEEMKFDHFRRSNENVSENKTEGVIVFKKINDLILSSSKLDVHPAVKEELKKPLEDLKKKHLLIRDLFFIHQSIKNSTYSEEVKKIKKNNIKRISQEIHDSLIIYEKNEALNPIILANLQIFKDYINKIRGAN